MSRGRVTCYHRLDCDTRTRQSRGASRRPRLAARLEQPPHKLISSSCNHEDSQLDDHEHDMEPLMMLYLWMVVDRRSGFLSVEVSFELFTICSLVLGPIVHL